MMSFFLNSSKQIGHYLSSNCEYIWKCGVFVKNHLIFGFFIFVYGM